MKVFIVQIRSCNCGFISAFGDRLFVYRTRKAAENCEKAIMDQWNNDASEKDKDLLPIEIIECDILKSEMVPRFIDAAEPHN